MLTGAEIVKRVNDGSIEISEFDLSRCNPNSYNLRLGNKLKVYSFDERTFLDSRKENKTREISIPESGLILRPGTLYLGTTIEKTSAKDLVMCIDGRSSIGRLGIEVHRTAGFGDVGFDGTWTLEITCVHPVKVYPGQEICQIYFEPVTGDTSMKYTGRYQHQDGVVASRLYMTDGDIS